MCLLARVKPVKRPTHPEVKLVSWGTHLAGLTVLLVAAALYHLGVARPLLRAEAKDEADIEELHKLQRSAVGTRREHKRLGQAVEELKQQAAAMRRRIPDESDEAEFLNDVARLASEVGIKVVEYRRGAVVHSDTHSQLDLEIKCLGSYAGICHFMDRLHHLPRITSVKHLAIHPDPNSSQYPLHVTLTLYFGIRANPIEESGNA